MSPKELYTERIKTLTDGLYQLRRYIIRRLWYFAMCLFFTTSVRAQNLITAATDAIRFSKRDFADTIKIKVMDRYDEEAQFKFCSPDGTEKSVRLKRTH